MKHCDLEGAANLPISELCTNGGYLVEICIEREEGRSLEYRNHDGNGQTLSVKSTYKYKTSNSKLKICTQ